MRKYGIGLVALIILVVFGFYIGADAACVHDSQAQNNGTCKADAPQNPNGT